MLRRPAVLRAVLGLVLVSLVAAGVPAGATAAPDLRAQRGSSGVGDAYFPLDGNGG